MAAGPHMILKELADQDRWSDSQLLTHTRAGLDMAKGLDVPCLQEYDWHELDAAVKTQWADLVRATALVLSYKYRHFENMTVEQVTDLWHDYTKAGTNDYDYAAADDWRARRGLVSDLQRDTRGPQS